MSKTDNRWQEFVIVGEVTAPHGIDGTVRIYPFTDFPDRLLELKHVWIDGYDGAQPVDSVREHKQMMLLRLERVTTRNDAEQLRGRRLYVPIASLNPLSNDTYYWYQLMGLTVQELGTGRVIGQLHRVIRTGGVHDLFEVTRSARKPLLVPALKTIVKTVDLSEQIMQVTLPEGLEELE